MAPSGDTTRIIQQQARQNQDRVLAESAVKGERMVAWIRFGSVLLRSITDGIILRLFGLGMVFDYRRMLAILLYWGFTLGVLAFYRGSSNVRRVTVAPVLFALLDYGFLYYVGLRMIASMPAPRLEMAAGLAALYLCFTVARFGWFHVMLSTALSIATFSALAWKVNQLTLAIFMFMAGTYLALGGLIAWLNYDLRKMFLNLRMRDNLSRFLPQQVVERLMEQGELAFQPVKREVTILFSDIRDFTTLSETEDPSSLLQFLDEYFADMSHIVKAHEGVVNKFLGDGMLAVWGAPDKNPAHAVHALRAALDMRKKLVEINDHRQVNGQQPIRIGIGVHTGVVAAGMLGGAQQHEYTVIGDAVNVASRIEGLTKVHACDILVSESTWRQVNGHFVGTKVAEEHVKGRHEAVTIYMLKDSSAA